MKRPLALLFSVLLATAAPAFAAEFHVSPTGSDATGDGSPQKPFASPAKARDAVRASKLAGKEDVAVVLHGGRYDLKETLLFSPEDSGTKEHPVVWRAAKGGTPLIDGGRRVTGWTKVAGKPYWKASAPVAAGFPDRCLQFYVDGVRATVARSGNVIKTTTVDPVVPKETAKPAPGAPGKPAPAKSAPKTPPPDTILLPETKYAHYRNPTDMRLLWVAVFKHMDAPVLSIADENGRTKIAIPASNPGHQNPTIYFTKQNGAHGAFLINAFEELDEPGEWYLDRRTREIFYYPRACENMAKADCVLPAVDTLVRVEGTAANPVHDLRFEGLSFEHGFWKMLMDIKTGCTQAERHTGAPGNAVPGQFTLWYATDIAITGCTLRHQGSCGITPMDGTRDVRIEGCLFEDLFAAGVSIGRFMLTPADCDAAFVPTDITVSNCVVRNTGKDFYPQATGINTFLCKRVRIEHCDVSDTSYTGIHARVGSGYMSPNVGELTYFANKVSRAFQGSRWGIADGGQLYVHGRCPKSLVAENYSIHASTNINNEYYSDNFSHSITWKDNVSRWSKARDPYKAWDPNNRGVVFDGNYAERESRHGHAKVINPHVVADGQWPEEAKRIMAAAGLEPKWRHLADMTFGHENLAQGRPCTASSEESGHTAAMGADDLKGAFWKAAPGAGDAWWQVDLGQAYAIGRIALLPRQDAYEPASQSNLEVVGANDPSFKDGVVLCSRNEVPWYRKGGGRLKNYDRFNERSDNEWEQYLPPGLGAFRYVRVRSTKPGSALSLAEVGVFGHPAGGRK